LGTAISAINTANGNTDLSLNGSATFGTADEITIASKSGVDINIASFSVANTTAAATIGLTAQASAAGVTITAAFTSSTEASPLGDATFTFLTGANFGATNDLFFAATQSGAGATALAAGGYTATQGVAGGVVQFVLTGSTTATAFTVDFAGGAGGDVVALAVPGGEYTGGTTATDAAGTFVTGATVAATAIDTAVTATSLVAGLDGTAVSLIEGGNNSTSVRGTVFVSAESGYLLQFDANATEFMSGAANATNVTLAAGVGTGEGGGGAAAAANTAAVTATGLVTGLNGDVVAPVETRLTTAGNDSASVRGTVFTTLESGYDLQFSASAGELLSGASAATNVTQAAGVGTGAGGGGVAAAANTAAVTATGLVTGLNGTAVAPVETRLTTVGNDSTSVRGQLIVSADSGYNLKFAANAAEFESGATDGTNLALTSATATIGIGEGNGVNAQTLSISGLSSQSVSIGADSTAKQIAAGVNAVSGTTGVTATARSEVTFSGLSASGTVSFNLYGSNTTAVAISAAVTVSDLSSLATAVNQRSGTTGITAEVTTAGSLKLTNSAGNDIKIENFRHSAAVTDASGVADAAVTIAATGMSGAAVTLTDGGTVAKGAQLDSTVVAGKVTLNSNAGPFSVTSDLVNASGGVLNTAVAGASVTSAKAKLSAVDISTAAGAQNAVDVIDAAMAQVNAIRADLGAIQNRFQSTVSNLTTTSENIASARSRIQDTDFAAETANLTRNQILQQAGVAMLAQANALPNIVLSLLK
jgi:flagellin